MVSKLFENDNGCRLYYSYDDISRALPEEELEKDDKGEFPGQYRIIVLKSTTAKHRIETQTASARVALGDISPEARVRVLDFAEDFNMVKVLRQLRDRQSGYRELPQVGFVRLETPIRGGARVGS